MLNVTLNESEIVKKALEGEYEENNIIITLNLLLKYYYIEGMIDRLKLREQLLNFLKNNYNGYKRAKWENTITKIVDRFLRVVRENKTEVKLIDIKEVKITKAELDFISKLNDIKLEKIAFIMLIYAKLSNVMMNGTEGWINKSCSTICKEAKVNLKGTDKEKIFNELYNIGYIKQRLHNAKTNMQVCYINEESETELIINDFDKVVYYYTLWKNQEMIRCERCSKPIKVTNNKRKYCSVCAKEVKLENDRKIQKERYEKVKFSQIESLS
jgi:uncharacterized protein YggT (Ycf19 family)